MGAFQGNLPGHYRYQRRMFTHFVQEGFVPEHRGIFLAGDDISFTPGWAEGAVHTALNAVWAWCAGSAARRPRGTRSPGTRSRWSSREPDRARGFRGRWR